MKDSQEKAAALRYRKDKDSAPSVVAKGRGQIAAKIIELARKNGVPIHEDRNLVEILSTLELYEEIPAELYKAIAEILSHLYALSGKM
jgi:flagellar biosynthesis protein